MTEEVTMVWRPVVRRRMPGATLIAMCVTVACSAKKDDKGKAALDSFRSYIASTLTEELTAERLTRCRFRSDVRDSHAVAEPWEGVLSVEGLVDDEWLNLVTGDVIYERTNGVWACSKNVNDGESRCAAVLRYCGRDREAGRAPAGSTLVQRRKSTEAQLQLCSIETKARRFRVNKGRFPASARAPMPNTRAEADCTYERKPRDAWEKAGWKELGFSVDEVARYRYTWSVVGRGDSEVATATAIGDLDCDGIETTQTLTLSVGGSDENADGIAARYSDATPD
jgi:hypothetical protein